MNETSFLYQGKIKRFQDCIDGFEPDLLDLVRRFRHVLKCLVKMNRILHDGRFFHLDSLRNFGKDRARFYDLVLMSHLVKWNDRNYVRFLHNPYSEPIVDLSKFIHPAYPLTHFSVVENLFRIPKVLQRDETKMNEFIKCTTPEVKPEGFIPQSGLEMSPAAGVTFADLFAMILQILDVYSPHIEYYINLLRDILCVVALLLYITERRPQHYFPQSGFESDGEDLPPQLSRMTDSGAEDDSIESPQIVVTRKSITKDASQTSSPYWIGVGVVLSVAPLVPGMLIGGSTLSGCLALSARLSYVPLAQCINYVVRHKYNLTFTHDFSNPELFKKQSGKERKIVHTLAPKMPVCSEPTPLPPTSLMRDAMPRIPIARIQQPAPDMAQTAEATVKASNVFRKVGYTNFFGE